MAQLSELQAELGPAKGAAAAASQHARGHKRMSSGQQKGLSVSASVPALHAAPAAAPAAAFPSSTAASSQYASNSNLAQLKSLGAKAKALSAMSHARQLSSSSSNGILPPMTPSSNATHSRPNSALGNLSLPANGAAALSAPSHSAGAASPALASRKPPLAKLGALLGAAGLGSPAPASSLSSSTITSSPMLTSTSLHAPPKHKQLLSALAPLRASASPHQQPPSHSSRSGVEVDENVPSHDIPPMPTSSSERSTLSSQRRSGQFRPATAPLGARTDALPSMPMQSQSGASTSSSSSSSASLAALKSKLLGAQQAAQQTELALSGGSAAVPSSALLHSAAKGSPGGGFSKKNASALNRLLSAQAHSPLRRA